MPRATLEIPGGARRLDRILELIRSCAYAIHDLSRVELDAHKPRTPRFNMPFELGLSVAYEKSSKKRKHEWFVCICLFEAIASLPFSRCGSSIEKCQRVSLSSCDKLALRLCILLVFLRISVSLLAPLLTVSSNKGSNGQSSATLTKNQSAQRGRLHTSGSVAGIRCHLRLRALRSRRDERIGE